MFLTNTFNRSIAFCSSTSVDVNVPNELKTYIQNGIPTDEFVTKYTVASFSALDETTQYYLKGLGYSPEKHVKTMYDLPMSVAGAKTWAQLKRALLFVPFVVSDNFECVKKSVLENAQTIGLPKTFVDSLKSALSIDELRKVYDAAIDANYRGKTVRDVKNILSLRYQEAGKKEKIQMFERCKAEITKATRLGEKLRAAFGIILKR